MGEQKQYHTLNNQNGHIIKQQNNNIKSDWQHELPQKYKIRTASDEEFNLPKE